MLKNFTVKEQINFAPDEPASGESKVEKGEKDGQYSVGSITVYLPGIYGTCQVSTQAEGTIDVNAKRASVSIHVTDVGSVSLDEALSILRPDLQRDIFFSRSAESTKMIIAIALERHINSHWTVDGDNGNDKQPVFYLSKLGNSEGIHLSVHTNSKN